MIEGLQILDSGFGYWQPLVWLGVFLVVWLLAVLIRSFGNSKYKPGTIQTQPFLSGETADPRDVHVKASNLYWGFTTSLQAYYAFLARVHTGKPGDYVIWFLGVMVVVFMVGVLA